jgi:hypothetical protein
MSRKLVSLAVAAAALLAPAAVAFAAPGFELQGTATLDSGHVQLVSDFSDATSSNDFGAINFTDTGVTTFSSLSTLSADFNPVQGGCGGGSPRFQLNVEGKNVFVYFGPAPSFTGCALNTWTNTGNLIGSTDARFDLSQLVPGTQSSTYAQALSLIGSQPVTGIQLVVDSGWFFPGKVQTVLVDNVVINGTTFTFESPSAPQNMDECKDGGWRKFTNPAFKNQGQCVSSVVSNRNHQNDDDNANGGED